MRTNFKMDRQTYKDLNVFADATGAEAIFSLFKATRTLGGKEKIQEMMEQPSSDIELLNGRKHAIKYFHDHKLSLAIKSEQLDLIGYYLKFRKVLSRNNMLDSLVDFIGKKTTNDYYIVTKGLEFLIGLLKYLSRFIAEQDSMQLPEYLKNKLEEIARILNLDSLKTAMSYQEKKMKFYQVSKLDHSFRGKDKEELLSLVQLVYELDAFETIATVARTRQFCFPEYSEKEELEVELLGFFHPSIDQPVKNDIFLNQEGNMVFLTGSNMAGKSSLLKSLGLAIYLSHLGFPVPAIEMKTVIFNGLLTTINLPDHIGAGLSHYYSEVRRVKEAATALLENDRMFVIFDELFRGTNVKDAYDASLLIISELANIRNSVFFISTHLVELAIPLKKLDYISFKHLDTFFEGEKPVFTYRLKEGVSEERLGMYIIHKEGIVDIIRAVPQQKVNNSA
ncbi:MutS-related protein [Pedobacter gandavensis]|uniref:DNA mismatch repair proteins mutS family domain-containing protein n=1 Tax=Pedobacter gandavensis TaxID=2679963 RepID=A0ABR6F288_9SPHI|nr:hypothetical protein [Pedobacter gandavensis]MBB2151332.1 hypothetical protein [Pedobacter gandavensis]